VANKKKKNTIIKDAIILCLITLIAGAALGYVYKITKEPIAKADLDRKNKAYKAVFNEAEDFVSDNKIDEKVKKSPDYLKEADFSDVIIEEVMCAKKGNDNLGYVVLATAKNGYGGDITIAVGIKKDKTVTAMEIMSISETPGLGMKAKEDDFKNQFNNKKVEKFEYTKKGKQADNEIDALSGATITTNAVTNAVNASVDFVDKNIIDKK